MTKTKETAPETMTEEFTLVACDPGLREGEILEEDMSRLDIRPRGFEPLNLYDAQRRIASTYDLCLSQVEITLRV